MSKPLIERIPFAKIVTMLAIVFGIALGLCGLTALVAFGASGGGMLFLLGYIELIVMIICAIGLAVTALVWVVLSAVNRFKPGGSEPLRLFDDSKNNDTKKDSDD